MLLSKATYKWGSCCLTLPLDYQNISKEFKDPTREMIDCNVSSTCIDSILSIWLAT